MKAAKQVQTLRFYFFIFPSARFPLQKIKKSFVTALPFIEQQNLFAAENKCASRRLKVTYMIFIFLKKRFLEEI